MPAGRTIEPVTAVFALGIRQSLLALALGALAVHFAVGDIIFKQQSAFGTRFCIAPEVRGLAVGCRANKNRPAILTPVLTFGLFLANWTLFHLHTLHKTL